MKKFIDEKGTFEIEVPFTWRYSLKNGKVHTFQEYEIWKHDAFQLSIRSIKDKYEKENYSNITKNLPTTKINGATYYSYPDLTNEDFITKTWTTSTNNKIILFSLTYPTNQKLQVEKESLETKIKRVKKIISKFKLIAGSESENKINLYRFEMFLQGVGLSATMLNKTIENKSFIETTCLLASYIDALLRIGIVLQKQIINKNSEIERKWIYQGSKDKIISEKEIYRKANELRIINGTIFDELYKLYNDRNRIIHRFIISEITIAEIEEIAYQYSQMLKKINKIVYDIESKQIKLNIGMTVIGKNDEKHNHLEHIKGKIGKINYFDKNE